MREQLIGYATGCGAVSLQQSIDYYGDLRAISSLLSREASLSEVLNDSGIDHATKIDLVTDLFTGSVSPASIGTLKQIVLLEEADSIVETVGFVARMADQEVLPSTGAQVTAARVRYFARAVFDLLASEEKIGHVESLLLGFRSVLEANRALSRALSGVGSSASIRQEIVGDLFTFGDSEVDRSFELIVRYMVSAGRIRDLLQLVDRVVALAGELRRTRVAEIRVAAPIDQDRLGRISATLSTLCGYTVETREVIDSQLLGGVLAIVGDTIYDGSVRHRLDLIKGRMSVAAVGK